MPKEEKHLKALRLLKKEKKNRRILDQPHKIYWQVMGAGGPGAPTSLFLFTDFQGYFFNCGEGSQRMTSFVNMSKSISQTENVFLTNKTWKNMGGLPGLCLTVRSYGSSEMTIHGPPGCMDIYEATKGFLTLMEFDVHEFTDRMYSDNSVNIEEILLHGSNSKHSPGLDSTWSSEVQDGSSLEYVNSVQAYILTFVPRVGKLDVEKCVDAGVPPGPLYGKLKAGLDVVLEDGRVIKSSEVVGDSSPATSCIVIEVPDREFLDSLEKCSKLKESRLLEYVFHFTPSHVAEDPRYISWMQQLPSSVHHVFLNENSKGMGLNGVTAHQHKLRFISGEMFPPLVGTAQDPTPQFNLESDICTRRHNLHLIQGMAGLKFNVRPSTQEKIELEESLIYDEASVTREVLEGEEIKCEHERKEYIEGLQKDLEFFKEYKSRIEESEELGPAYPVISFLGTGSAVPSKYRNVSSILVEVKPKHFILLDCGEGSLSQLHRLHGRTETDRILMDLKAIYISHQHADHQIGTINLILAREEAFRKAGKLVENLFIIVTGKYAEYLVTYHRKIQSVLSHAQLVKCEDLILHTQKDEYMMSIPGDKIQLINPSLLQSLLSATGLKELETCRAVHCAHAFCLAFRNEEGYKVTYSGDTRPCQQLVNLGRGSDLLIHEATMEHSLIDDAKIKKHSTFTEAVTEGEDMEAKFTLLTHFSQRYSKIPLLDEIQGKENVGIAFDNMVVNPVSMRTIPGLYPALKRIFHSEVREMEEKTLILHFNNVEKTQNQESGKSEILKKLEKKYENKQKVFEHVNQKHSKKREKEERKRLQELQENKRKKQKIAATCLTDL